MSEVVEIKSGTVTAEVVTLLAAGADDSSLSLSVEREIKSGEWVRFSVCLEDGTQVLEGVGRSTGSLPRGNPVASYDLHLAELQFDERNEIMFERVLIAKVAAQTGDDTGAMRLSDTALEQIEASASDEREEATPGKNVPPPPPAASKTTSKRSAPPAVARTRDSPPPKRASTPPKRASTPPKGTSTPPKRTSSPPKADKPSADKSPSSAKKAAPDERPSPRKAASGRPPIADGEYMLEVAPDLVATARRLGPSLPRKVLAGDRKPGKPEAAVLATALRIGLASLEALVKEDD